jgi:hypothetical protein
VALISGGQLAVFPANILLEYRTERYFEAGEGAKAI